MVEYIVLSAVLVLVAAVVVKLRKRSPESDKPFSPERPGQNEQK